MTKELDYIADLERENRLVKSFLYCTTKSCNNCGKVNCENFQRQRVDCCGLWVSYKDYIKQLENKIADIKANCDLAIEGRDIKINELEEENAELKEEMKAKQVVLNDFKSRVETVTDRFNKKSSQLTKAKEILVKLLEEEKNNMYWEMNGSDKSSYYEVRKQAEQFLQEIEK